MSKKFGGLGSNEFQLKLKLWHPWQLNKLKSWRPFGALTIQNLRVWQYNDTYYTAVKQNMFPALDEPKSDLFFSSLLVVLMVKPKMRSALQSKLLRVRACLLKCDQLWSFDMWKCFAIWVGMFFCHLNSLGKCFMFYHLLDFHVKWQNVWYLPF